MPNKRFYKKVREITIRDRTIMVAYHIGGDGFYNSLNFKTSKNYLTTNDYKRISQKLKELHSVRVVNIINMQILENE